MLEPMFGDWGSLIVQFLVTVGVVLALIAVVYWLVRRYSSGGLGRIGRGRVPRLAIVDAMPVDGRRRLVLVRRDNIEHLILIGGPSDLVVEQSIQRPRRPTAKPAEAAPAGPTAVPATAENPPIPFPTSRAHQAASAQAGDRPFFPARRAATPQPAAARIEPARIEQVSAAVQFQEMAETEPLFPEMPEADLPLPVEEPTPLGPSEASNGHQPHLNFEAPAASGPFVMPVAAADEDTVAKVNDLEREMARLLSEITQKGPS